MENLLLMMISIMPVVVIGIYFYKKDNEKEPVSFLVKLFLSGIVSCFLVGVITNVLSVFMPFLKESIDKNTPFELIINTFIGIGFTEEFSKWLMTYVIGYNSKHFDEKYDIVIYSVFVCLGFALFENIIYVLSRGMAIGIFRALVAVPAHTCNAVFMGYYLSKAKLCLDSFNRKKYIIYSILAPTTLHGLYNYCLFMKNEFFIVLFFVFVISLFVFTLNKVSVEVKNNKKITEN